MPIVENSINKTITFLREELRRRRNLSQKVNSYVTKSVRLEDGFDLLWKQYYERERMMINRGISDMIRAIDILDDAQKSYK